MNLASLSNDDMLFIDKSNLYQWLSKKLANFSMEQVNPNSTIFLIGKCDHFISKITSTIIVYRFYYICYKVIPIIHHEKKLSYTRLEPQLVEVLGWHQTMSTLQRCLCGHLHGATIIGLSFQLFYCSRKIFIFFINPICF